MAARGARAAAGDAGDRISEFRIAAKFRDAAGGISPGA